MDPSIHIAQRDTAPIRYWIVMGLQMIAMASCVDGRDIWLVASNDLSIR